MWFIINTQWERKIQGDGSITFYSLNTHHLHTLYLFLSLCVYIKASSAVHHVNYGVWCTIWKKRGYTMEFVNLYRWWEFKDIGWWGLKLISPPSKACTSCASFASGTKIQALGTNQAQFVADHKLFISWLALTLSSLVHPGIPGSWFCDPRMLESLTRHLNHPPPPVPRTKESWVSSCSKESRALMKQ